MHGQRKNGRIKFTRDQQARRSNELLNDRLKHISLSLAEFKIQLNNLINANYDANENRKLGPSPKQPRQVFWYLSSRFCLKKRWNSNGEEIPIGSYRIGNNDFGDAKFGESRLRIELRNYFGVIKEVKRKREYIRVSSFKKTFMQFNCY